MTSSGTYNFGLDNGSLVVESFERLGIMPVELTRQHFLSSRRSLNLEMQAWTNRGVNLWEVQSFTVELAVGQITYAAGAGLANIPQQIQNLLELYYTVINGGGSGVNTDRIMLPIGRDDYAAYPNKLQQGTPTTYWYQKLEVPQVTVYQAPIEGYPTVQLGGNALLRMQDANINGTETPDIPYHAIDALCDGLAVRLARKFAPTRMRDAVEAAKQSWSDFVTMDQEDAPRSFDMDFSGYFLP